MFTLALCLLAPVPGQAAEDDTLRTFATCAGRLSAVMEFQWMFDGPASELTATRRAAVIDLIEAIMAPDDGRRVLAWRLAAKEAQARLLTRATFNDDPADAAWARAHADGFERDCTALLLS